MSPADVRVHMNPNFGRDLKRDIDAKAQRVVDLVAREHAGETAEEIGSALDDGLAAIGLNLPKSTLDPWAAVLAASNDLKVDIHLV